MIPQKEKATVQPMAQKDNQQLGIYPNASILSRSISTDSTFILKQHLEAGMWNILCIVMGSGIDESEKVHSWQLFGSYLRCYIGVLHEEGQR